MRLTLSSEPTAARSTTQRKSSSTSVLCGVRQDGVTLVVTNRVAVPATSFRRIAAAQGDAIVSQVHEADRRDQRGATASTVAPNVPGALGSSPASQRQESLAWYPSHAQDHLE